MEFLEYLSDFSTRRPPWSYLVSSFVSQSFIRGDKIRICPTIPKLNFNTFQSVLNSINIRRIVQKLGDVTDGRTGVLRENLHQRDVAFLSLLTKAEQPRQ
jgi:hypothetical protein